MKQCRGCKELLPLTSFHRNKTMSDGRINFCKACEKIKHKSYKDAYYTANRQLVKDRGKSRAYGISATEYHKRMSSSNCCEICGKTDKLCYDHCHDTMEFRGVLCSSCNRGLGFLGDTLNSLVKAKNYLERYYGKR